MIAELWVPGRPKSKQRPRMTRRGRVYTPAETLEAEQAIANAWTVAHGPLQFDGPVAIQIDYYDDGQWIVVRDLEADRRSSSRADIDNLAKLTLDGLQKAALVNDKSVMDLWVAKH